MLDLLRLVDTGRALRPESRALLMDMMRRCATGTNRIPALLPPGVRVEHKTGTLNGYTSDVGFLTLPGGRRIAVAFFARYGENRAGVIATAARAVYDAFAPGARWPLINTTPRIAGGGLSPGALPAGACTAAAGMNATRC
jgi:beta-lactamase class A